MRFYDCVSGCQLVLDDREICVVRREFAVVEEETGVIVAALTARHSTTLYGLICLLTQLLCGQRSISVQCFTTLVSQRSYTSRD